MFSSKSDNVGYVLLDCRMLFAKSSGLTDTFYDVLDIYINYK